ncbi:hypothetical protein B0H17DRAFT_1200286 [Mycena rosella]|uniref:Uncharacterized protein n=1 Tax=Mycena rosella TaxID=1033263 RepID=A0AAD7DM02_MYCRO|nr:hypothetical protein B0H17DRAFT_1200286 [Mycena rosella]
MLTQCYGSATALRDRRRRYILCSCFYLAGPFFGCAPSLALSVIASRPYGSPRVLGRGEDARAVSVRQSHRHDSDLRRAGASLFLILPLLTSYVRCRVPAALGGRQRGDRRMAAVIVAFACVPLSWS